MSVSVHHFTTRELQVARQVNNYFRSNDMSFRDKMFHAMLIAQYELEGHNFGSEEERLRIEDFQRVLSELMIKIPGTGLF